MNHINTLKDLGRGRKCLIVGGGQSLNGFDWFSIPKDTYIICTNNHEIDYADMIIYYDKDMKEYYTNNNIKPFQLLLSFRHKKTLDYTCSNTTHYYTYDDMVFGDSGYHALQFADKIFNFKEIYLIGFDYTIKGGSYHHDEDISDPKKLERFKTWSIGRVLKQYTDTKWKNKIYNCNKYSAIDIFNYKLPH